MAQPFVVTRRTLLLGLIAAPAWAADDQLVSIAAYNDLGKRLGVQKLPKVVKTDEEWRALLSPVAYEVTRRADTEQPFTGATYKERAKGIYRCICCDTALFSSSKKYETGTGWPSFWTPIDRRNIREHEDRSMREVRTAISCALCDAHIGHVFTDGPAPTFLRYCMNSAAMRFVRS